MKDGHFKVKNFFFFFVWSMRKKNYECDKLCNEGLEVLFFVGWIMECLEFSEVILKAQVMWPRVHMKIKLNCKALAFLSCCLNIHKIWNHSALVSLYSLLSQWFKYLKITIITQRSFYPFLNHRGLTWSNSKKQSLTHQICQSQHIKIHLEPFHKQLLTIFT